MTNPWSVKVAVEKHLVGYVLVDPTLKVTSYSQAAREWMVEAPADPTGRPISQLFPELIGSEDELQRLMSQPGSQYTIAKIHRPAADEFGHYFDLQVEMISGLALLVTLVDVTGPSLQEQQLRQQRNELRLLSTSLKTTNEQLTYLIQHFVPGKFAQDLIHTRNLPALGGSSRREATVLFADMRQFSAFVDTAVPEEALEILNAYFAVIATTVRRHDGVIVQMAGDMLMAAFNAPADVTNHSLSASQAALDIQTSLKTYIANDKPADWPAMGFGIGLSVGHVVSGYAGVPGRYRYAVFGDSVNVAFHLCSRAAAGQILISQEMLDKLGSAAIVRPLGNVAILRRRKPAMSYELIEIVVEDKTGG